MLECEDDYYRHERYRLDLIIKNYECTIHIQYSDLYCTLKSIILDELEDYLLIKRLQ